MTLKRHITKDTKHSDTLRHVRLEDKLRTFGPARALKFALEDTRDLFSRRCCGIHQLVLNLKKLDVELVVDVGANVGQFAIDLRRHGYRGAIISFEPIASAFQKLKKTSRNDMDWEVVHSALGSQSGRQDLNIASNAGLSSSFLNIDESADIEYIGKESVNVSVLDEYIDRIIMGKSVLKIDAQGFELEILHGASESLSKFVSLYVECSLVPSYLNQPNFFDICDFLAKHDFRLFDVHNGYRRKEGLVEIDAHFLKHDTYSNRNI